MEGGTGVVQQFQRVVPPAFAHQHAMRMHLAAAHYPPTPYENRTDETNGTAFDCEMRDVGEHEAYTDEPFMEEFAGLDGFDSIRAAPPDSAVEAVAVRGDNMLWERSDHPALGHRHNGMSRTLYTHHVSPLPPGMKLQPLQLDRAVLIIRRRSRDSPRVVKDILKFVTDQAHAETVGGPALWRCGEPKEDSFNKYGHVATHSCATVPGSTRHRDRHVVVFS